MASQIDEDAFRNFERDAHDRIAASYNNLFAGITEHAITPLLDAAQVRTGMRVLDVASGPGRLTSAAAARGALAVGCDLAPAMVDLARSLNPSIRFDEASADALPYSAASFEALLCAFGIGHFPDPERVMAEFPHRCSRRPRSALLVGGVLPQSRQRHFPRGDSEARRERARRVAARPAHRSLFQFANLCRLRTGCWIHRSACYLDSLNVPFGQRRSALGIGDG
jgi:SAM-dependent methyltransferase